MRMSLSRPLSVLAIPAFADNYLWLIHDGVNAAIVDPGDAAPVLDVLRERRLTLTAILLTHHHADHVGGVPGLLARYQVPVFGPHNRRQSPASRIHWPKATASRCLDRAGAVGAGCAGHTLAILPTWRRARLAVLRRYLVCRRLRAAVRRHAGADGGIARKLTALPDRTAVYCAHEYTLSNLKFAREVEPENAALLTRISVRAEKT